MSRRIIIIRLARSVMELSRSLLEGGELRDRAAAVVHGAVAGEEKKEEEEEKRDISLINDPLFLSPPSTSRGCRREFTAPPFLSSLQSLSLPRLPNLNREMKIQRLCRQR